MLGLDPEVIPLMVLAFAAGLGMEVFSIGWQTAYHEHMPNEILSRRQRRTTHSGSFVSDPDRAASLRTRSSRCSIPATCSSSRSIAYFVIAASTLLSRSVRTLGRAEINATQAEAADRVAE